MATPAKHKAGIALGVVLVMGMLGMETVVADHLRPNPLSPFVWTGLGTIAALALAAWFHYRAAARREAAARS